MPNIDFILTDIEGTTTSVAFVYETLFPYFLQHFSRVQSAAKEPWVAQELERVRQTVAQEEGRNLDEQEALAYLCKWVEEDRKHPALKNLQGQIWKEGYETGQLKGHVYPDVAPVLRAWHDKGLHLGVYSSGSVAAQHLLFGNSEAGDLRPLFEAYFDTAVGHKREAASYRHIAQVLNRDASRILFLSDVGAELDAAQAAGMNTTQLLRPGIVPCEGEHRQAADFEEVSLIWGL